ncbi:MAG: TetR/AcrR family transcriptional regulator [Fibrella sp.]|nr:TetR/AcrR family transcriptional regulator [Armatimonadota bacterium]
MRYKPEHKEETRRRIVASAAKEFRTHGFESVGIANLMGALNLTHGGFYAHFADKEGLVAESVTLALKENLAVMLPGLKSGGLPALITYYLSEEHRDQPFSGCPLPALAAEIARRPPASRDAFTEELSEVFDAVALHMLGDTDEQRRASVCFLFASMAGAVSMARAVSDDGLSKTILESAREHLLRLFPEEPR